MAAKGSSLVTAVKNNFSILLATCAAAVLLGMLAAPASCDDGGNNFFLKASKSVPRIGRRSENFFLKASKTVPRIGRRSQDSSLTEAREAFSSWPWYRSTGDSIPGPSRRAEEIPKDQYEENLTWTDLEKAMEHNPEMWTPDLLKELVNQKENLEYQRRLQAMSGQT